MTVNVVAEQYILRTNPSCSSDRRTTFSIFWFFPLSSPN